ncbi:MAG: PriCT-2 domain-containing protein [Sphingomonadaceae bacterium]
MTEYSRARSALSCIPSHDRDTWVRMGMAIHSEFGPDGFSMWDHWSRQADNYKPADAKAVWRSFKGGAITIATLYAEAMAHGWEDDGYDAPIDPEEKRRRRQEARIRAEQEEAERQAGYARVAKESKALLAAAKLEPHLYLDSKGFRADEFGGRGLVAPSGELLIPMREQNSIWNVQRISPDGTKKFLHGGRAKGLVHCLGNGPEKWLCEGYATGLSVFLALKSLYRQATVVVCFSAGNLIHIAEHIKGRRYVVADNDESKTGENAAIKTGLPWCMPPDVGHDANDMHQARGIRAVADMMRKMLATT